MSRVLAKGKKLAVLEVVKKNKEKLFGSFQNNVTSKTEKEDAWKEVLSKAKSLGLASNNRKWQYARDHIFGLWKSRTLAKRDNAQRTGTGGGKEVILDEVDEAVLDIIGSESPVVEGLRLLESDGVKSIGIEAIQPQVDKPQMRRTTTQKRKSGGHDNSDSMESLKKRVLESELYKNKLQILKLERDLGLPPSDFTKDLVRSGSSDENIQESSTNNLTTTILNFVDF